MFLAAFTSAWAWRPQARHRNLDWLSRDSGSRCPQPEQVCDVYTGLIFSTRPGALSARRRTSSPHPDRRISRFSPALAPTFRPGLLRPPSGAGHIPDLQILDPDQVKPPRDVRAGLFRPVLAPVRFAGAHPADRVPDPPAPIRAPSSPRESPLQAQQPLPLPHGQAGDAQQFSCGQSRADSHAPIDAHGLSVARCRDWIGRGREGDMPASRPVLGHPVGLHAQRYHARPAKPHPPGLRHPDLAGLPAKPAHVPLPSAPSHDPEPLIPPGLAPRRSPSRVARVEKRGHRPGEVPQCLLLHHLAACSQPVVLRPRLGELSALFQIAWPARPAGAPVPVLFNGQIPHVPGVPAVIPQYRFLGGCGKQPVPERHTNILANTTDISGEVKRRFLPAGRSGSGRRGPDDRACSADYHW